MVKEGLVQVTLLMSFGFIAINSVFHGSFKAGCGQLVDLRNATTIEAGCIVEVPFSFRDGSL